MKNYALLIPLSLLAMELATTSVRAESDFPVVTSAETNYVGAAVVYLPDYVGSDDYDFSILPAFRYEFGDHRNIEIVGNFATANLINHENLRFGPSLRYRFGRDDDIDDDAVKLLPEIDDTLEAGFTFGGDWVLHNNPRNRFVAGIDALWDTGGESNGMNSNVYARYWKDVSEAIDLGIAGNIVYGDSNFNDTYFGVSNAGSAASGLPFHDAESGLVSFSIQPMIAYHLNEKWHIGAGLRYMRLTGDAADSPIVDDRGDENQFIGGIGVVYTWGAKVNKN